MKVKAEGKEFILRNEVGDMAIIPKALGGRIQQLLDVGNNEEIDNIVNSLPSSEDYAEDGSLYIGGKPTEEKPKGFFGTVDETIAKYAKKPKRFTEEEYADKIKQLNKDVEYYTGVSDDYKTRYEKSDKYDDKSTENYYRGKVSDRNIQLQKLNKDYPEYNNEYAYGGTIDPPTNDPVTEKEVIEQGRQLDPYQTQAAQKSFGTSYDYVSGALGDASSTLEDRDRGYGFNAQRDNTFAKSFNASIANKTPYVGTGEETMFTLNPGRDMVVDKSNPNINPSLKPGGREYNVSVNAYRENPGAYSDIINSTAGLDQFNEYLGVNQKAYGGPIKAEAGLSVKGGGKKKVQQQNFEASQKQQTGLFEKMKSMFKSEPTELNVPEVSNEPMSEEDMIPSITEFGKEEVSIPKSIYTSRKKLEIEDKKDMEVFLDWDERAERDEEGDYKKDDKGNYITPYEMSGKYGIHPKIQGCMGSGCRVRDRVLNDLPGYYEVRSGSKYGNIESISTGQKGKTNKDFYGPDTWESPQALKHLGLADYVFATGNKVTDYEDSKAGRLKFNKEAGKYREEFLKDEGWNKVSPGDILTHGTAEGVKEGSYTNRGDKTTIKYKDGSTEEIDVDNRERHTSNVLSYEENGNMNVYNYGNYYTVGYAKGATHTPEEYFKEKDVNRVTRIKATGDWSKNRLDRIAKHNRAMQPTKPKN